MTDTTDYRKFYNLEAYLLSEVGPAFQSTGRLEPLQFLAILIWKSNRARTKHMARLNERGGTFSGAVSAIAAGLTDASDQQARLKILMQVWGFRLPTATAILSILYPEEFTVYDIRVCEMLQGFHGLTDKPFSERLWLDYQRFVQTVKDNTPARLNLRDKDRHLWGKSWYEDTLALVR